MNIIYIAGNGHSGSTLLGRLLAGHPSVTSIGSMKGVQKRLRSGGECSCGAPADDCEVWSGVIRYLRGLDMAGPVDVAELTPKGIALAQTALRMVAEAAGTSHVCEATHQMPRAGLYARYRIGTVNVVHLVRDPRAVLFSQMRKGRPPFAKAFSLIRNAAFQESRRILHYPRSGCVKYLRVRYEDLCGDPCGQLSRIFRFAGLNDWISLGCFPPEKGAHILGGNRMSRMPLKEVRQSTDYLTETEATWWIRASLLTLPVLLKYGYPISRAGAVRRAGESAGAMPGEAARTRSIAGRQS